MDFKCPNCKATFRVKDELAGKNAKCQKCGARFIIPHSSPRAQQTAKSPDKQAEPPRTVFTLYDLRDAVQKGDLQRVRELIAAGADANWPWDETPLEFAAHHYPECSQETMREIVKLFLEHGADPNVKNGYGQTPLQCAVVNGCLGVAEALLAHGCEVNSVDLDGCTPLHSTAVSDCIRNSTDRVALARMLLEHGANTEARNHRGQTTLDIAMSTEKRAALVRLLRNWPPVRDPAEGPAVQECGGIATGVSVAKTVGPGFFITEISGTVDAISRELNRASEEIGELYYDCPKCGYSIRINDIGKIMLKSDVGTFKSQFGNKTCKKCGEKFIAFTRLRQGNCPHFDYANNCQRN